MMVRHEYSRHLHVLTECKVNAKRSLWYSPHITERLGPGGPDLMGPTNFMTLVRS